MAGASEGLGLAFAEELARTGYDLLLLARREEVLRAAGEHLSQTYDVRVETHAFDLADDALQTRLLEWVDCYPPGVAVYNAAYAPVGPFVSQSSASLMRVVDVNIRGPLLWAHAVAKHMVKQGGGRFILMSSLAGEQGSPNLSAYAASKAFNTIFAEGLWYELRQAGVKVQVCCAGAVRTPGYADAAVQDAPGTLDAQSVARATLAKDSGGPRNVPGWINKLAALTVGRWLPRSWAVAVMARATRELQ